MESIFPGNQILMSVNIIIAFFAGGLIGYTRIRNNRPAGIRTQALVCAGSALLSGLSINLGVDPTRLMAQIVTGIGFLGGGVILQNKGRVKGITTAAIIWFTSALGMAIGSGFYLLAFVGYILFVLTSVIARIEYSTGIKTKPFAIKYFKRDEDIVEKVLDEVSTPKVLQTSTGNKIKIVILSSWQRNSKIRSRLDDKKVWYEFVRLNSIDEY